MDAINYAETSIGQPPLVTICIPTYGGARFITAALDSVRVQSYKNLEILVVDNASSDNTDQIVTSIQDERLRFIRNPQNIGMVNNFRKCFLEARGDYLLFLCSDDRLQDPDLIDKALNILLSDLSVVAVFGGISYVDENGIIIGEASPLFTAGERISDLPNRSVRAGLNFVYLATCLFRRSAVPADGVFIDNKFFDWHLWLTLASQGDFVYLGPGVSQYRMHGNNETKTLADPGTHTFELIKTVERFLESPNGRHFQGVWSQGKSSLLKTMLTSCLDYRQEGGSWRAIVRSACRVFAHGAPWPLWIHAALIILVTMFPGVVLKVARSSRRKCIQAFQQKLTIQRVRVNDL